MYKKTLIGAIVLGLSGAVFANTAAIKNVNAPELNITYKIAKQDKKTGKIKYTHERKVTLTKGQQVTIPVKASDADYVAIVPTKVNGHALLVSGITPMGPLNKCSVIAKANTNPTDTLYFGYDKKANKYYCLQKR